MQQKNNHGILETNSDTSSVGPLMHNAFNLLVHPTPDTTDLNGLLWIKNKNAAEIFQIGIDIMAISQ